jgi:hypothetical protein
MTCCGWLVMMKRGRRAMGICYKVNRELVYHPKTVKSMESDPIDFTLIFGAVRRGLIHQTHLA